MASVRKFLLLSAFVASTVAVPVSQQSGQCARYCTDESDFSLRPGSTYTYDYETTTVTTVQGSSQDKTQLQMTAQVDIEVISKCELAMRLREVSLKHSHPESPEYLGSLRGSREFSRSLEKQVLHFSFQNGQVEHVCPSENAPAWVTNIQKGALSAFQTFKVKTDWTTRTVETDILGKCVAEYHSLGRSWQGDHTIRKLKDLASCTDRENIESYFQGTPYSPDFNTRSLPAVKGTQECEQVISDSFVQTSTCSEKLLFRPFSSRSSGVVTTVSQKLIFAAVSQRGFARDGYRPSSTQLLLYSHAKEDVTSAKIEEETEKALKELCEVSKDDITLTVPRKFSNLVTKMKKLNLRSLKTLYEKSDKVCPDNTKARKFFMDAVPLVGTSDSAHFMYEMISRKIISEYESSFWLTSLSFVTDATPQVIATFTPLLEGRYDQAILGVSSLIRNFCKDKDCSAVPEVQAAVRKLTENLGENCFNANEKTVILSLKAIGNIGHSFGKENILEACYKNPQIRTETRLAAIDAFRRVSCDVNREELLKTYSNYNEDTEIRIAAYLAVMKCPSLAVIQEVKNVMMKETINHVGSFIWTHMNALSKTRHPDRQEIRNIVSNLYLMNKFASDARKFSTAHEATFFLESLDSGIHVDSHIIFSTDSYIPRSAMFNLTVDVFGKTCNLFQIDGRLEGLERVAESFFGPNGYFPQKEVSRLLRERRSLDNNKLKTIDNQFKTHLKNQQDPYGSLDVKVFGTSMWYDQFRANGEGNPEIKLVDIVTKLAEEKDNEYSRSFTFLDTTFTVPMTSGLPLKIALNGTASVNLKIGGKFDVKSLEHVDVLGHIEPSGAVEIASLLTVDAGNVARSGMRVVSTMHSSSVLDGKVEVRNGEVVNMQLNMPKDRIDVFNIQSKLYLVHGLEEKEKLTSKKSGTSLHSCTGKAVTRVLGVQFCSELEIPPYRANSPLHPFNGPASFNLYIEKTDPTLKSYNFDAQWLNEKKNGGIAKYGVVSFSTPNSKMDRDVKLELYLNQNEHSATFKLKSPVKKIGAKAKFVNSDAQKKLDFSMTVDDRDYFTFQSEMGIKADKNSALITPSLEIRLPERRLVAVSGSAELRHGTKYTAQLKVEDLTEKPITARVNMELGKRDRYEIEMSLNSFPLDGNLKGFAQMNDNMACRLTADYRIMESKMNKFSIVGKVRNLSANSLTKYTGQLNIQASVLPEWNTEVKFESMRTTGHMENTVSLSLGDGVRSRVHTIEMQEIVRYDGSLLDNKVDASFSLAYPEKNLNYAVKMVHENTDHSLKNQLQIKYDERNEVNTDLHLKMAKGDVINALGDLKVRYPGREAGLKAELSQSAPKEYRSAVTCQWQRGRQASAVLHYKDKTDDSKMKHEVEGSLNLPSYDPITFSSSVSNHRGQMSAFADVTLRGEKYRGKVDVSSGYGLNQRLSGQLNIKNNIYALDAASSYLKDKLSGNVEVKMPNRHRATAKLECKLGESMKFGLFETYWDADRDTSKRFTVSGELKSQSEGYDAKVSMQVRRRMLKGALSTSLQGTLFSSQWKTNNKFDLEWSPSERMSGVFSSNVLFDRSKQLLNNHIEITTPYYGFENISFSLTHLFTNQQWNSELSTVLPKRSGVTLSSSGKYTFARGDSMIEASGKLQTTYRGLEEVKVSVAHHHNSRELSNTAELKWGMGQKMVYEVTGSKQGSSVRGSVKVMSPFSYARDLSGDFTYLRTGSNYKTMAAVQWSPSERVEIKTEGKHELNGRRRICTAIFEATSPFRGYENTGMKMVYNNDGVTVSTDSEMSWNRKKITSSMSVVSRSQGYNRNIEGKLLFTTPFRYYETFQLSSSLEMSPSTYKINLDSQMPYRSAASFNSHGKMTSLNDIEVNVVLMGQAPRYMRNSQKISLDIVHKIKNAKLSSSLDTTYGEKRFAVLLTGSVEYGRASRLVEASASVNTPFKGFEEMKTEFSHNQRGSEYYSKLTANKNDMSASFVHNLNFEDISTFETTFELESSHLPNGKVSVMQATNGRKMEHKSYALWNKNQKVQLDALFLFEKNMKEAVLKLTHPFRSYRGMELKTTLEHSNMEHKGSIALIWDRRNTITLKGDFKNYQWQGMTSNVEFTSPFRGHELYSASVKYDVMNSKKEGEVQFAWDARETKSVTAKGSFMNTRRFTQVEALLTTPFEGFDRVSLNSKYESNAPENALTINYERGDEKFSFDGKTNINRNSGEISAELKTPFMALRQFKTSANYNTRRDGMEGEIKAGWENRDGFKLLANYKCDSSSVRANADFSSRFHGYERIVLEGNAKNENSRLSSEVSLQFGKNERIYASGSYFSNRGNGEIGMKLLTPFDGYTEMSLASKYKYRSGKYEGDLKMTRNEESLFEGSSNGIYVGEHLAQMEVFFTTPTSPYRDVQMMMSLDATPEKYQLLSTLKWEDKKTEFLALWNNQNGKVYEAKLKLETPFESFNSLMFHSLLKNDRNQFMEGSVTIVTPFEILRKFIGQAEYKNDDNGCYIKINAGTPLKKLKIEGNLSNGKFQPLTATLEIEAPFLSFKRISSNFELDMAQWENSRAVISTQSPTFNHKMEVSLSTDSEKLNFEAKAESSAFRKIILSAKYNYKDPQRITVEASAEVLGKVHYVNGQYKNIGRNMDLQFETESHLLPERKFNAGVKLNRRRGDKLVDGEITFSVPSSNHQISAKYENKGSLITLYSKLDTSLLYSSPVECQLKYTNNNNRDVEVGLSVTTREASHAITGSLRNYEEEKFAQLKIECPMISQYRPFTVTATLKHEGFRSMDGSLSISTPESEVRIAGKMKTEGSDNVEAFLTINTPFESLKMARLDGKFRNDRFQNMEGNIQLQTSNHNLPSLGVTSKLSRTQGSDEMSLMLSLPLRNYRSVQLLGNVHYNADLSSADSRITFTLPKNKYVVYGQYGIGRTRISGRGEVEVDNDKWSVTGRLERGTQSIKDVSLTLLTPSTKTYSVGGAFGSTGNQHQVAASYSGPRNEKYSWNSTITADSFSNFGIEFQAESPFYGYRSLQGSLQHQSTGSKYLSTNLEYTKEGRRGFLKVNHRVTREWVKGFVQMGCPYSRMQDVKLSYSRSEKYANVENKIELDYNRAKQLKMEVLLREKSSHFVLDVPALPLTVTADSKAVTNGHELSFKSNCNFRVVSFRTSYQIEPHQIVHDAAFSWDERAEKRASYEFKLSETVSGQELWTRVDTPLRSFMLKGNFTKTSRARSGGVDFYWDAARSLEKHVAVGLSHADISSGPMKSHRVQIVMEHPKLSRDIIQTNILSYSPSEFQLKSELHYSRDRDHNLVFEVKANVLTRSQRERHYKGELTLMHPASRMDIRGVAEVMDGRLESSANIVLQSVDRHQGQNVRELKMKIMKLRQEIEMMMRSNGDHVIIAGQIAGRNGEYDIGFDSKVNDKEQGSARIQYSRRNKALDVTLMNPESSGIQLTATFPKESASLKISHSSKGRLVNDVNLFLGLEQSKLLKSKMNWRPRMLQDLRITTGETLRSVIRSVKSGFSAWSASFSQEVSTRVALLSRAMQDTMTPFVEDVKNGLNEMNRDAINANDAFWRMYYRNEFYMMDVVSEIQVAKKVAKDITNGISLGCFVLYNITMEQLENMYDSLYYTCLDMCDYMQKAYGNMMWKVERGLKSAKEAIENGFEVMIEKMCDFSERSMLRMKALSYRMLLQVNEWAKSYAPFFIDGYYYIKNFADQIRFSVNEMTTSVTKSVTTNSYYLALMDYATSVMNTINAFLDYEYTLTAQAFLNRIYDAQLLDNIINHPTVNYLSDAANSALRKSVEVYHNLGLDVVAANVAESAYNYAKSAALSSAQDYLAEFYQTKSGAKYEFSPQRGLVSFEVTLPATRNSLVEVFDIKSYPEYQKMIGAGNLVADYYEDFCVWDYYYNALKYFTPRYWLPAFSAHAMMSGNQHFITFDGLAYDFAGRCSYLLARDFVDGNFSAVVNYGAGDHRRRSLTLLIDDRKVDVGSDYKITLDDVKTELPFQIRDTVVMRDGANVRVDNQKKGLSIVCNFVHNYCSVSLSGFYFGKTAGLFGTFNHEPSLDMMTPARYVMGDVESFVASWEVGQGVCQTENLATLASKDRRVQEWCKELFEKSTSPYRPCFKQVDPEAFLNMCVRDLSAVHENDRKDAICESAGAYFAECKAEGVTVRMPKNCVRCEKQDGSYMVEGDSIQFPRDGRVTAADVVFLIEEKACNKDRVKYLPKLAQSIEDNYRQKGFRDVRFSVVGFGGDQVHADPHVHTMDGLESGPLRSLESAFQSLVYGDGPVNILEAVRFAASLNFRPGTTKSFVLMKCSTCKSEELKAEYSELLRTLLDGDITLHLLMDQRFEMKNANRNSKSRRVIGIDKKFAYTLKDVKDSRLSGDGELLAQLRVVKDVCIPLAFEVNGTSFDAQFLTDTKKNTNKKFVDVLSRLVARDSEARGSADWGMCCECLPDQHGVGKSACQRCVSREIASMMAAETFQVASLNEDSRNAPKSRPRKHKERRSGL